MKTILITGAVVLFLAVIFFFALGLVRGWSAPYGDEKR